MDKAKQHYLTKDAYPGLHRQYLFVNLTTWQQLGKPSFDEMGVFRDRKPELQNYELKIKNNTSKFSYFNIYCNLFINLVIDGVMYNVFISKYIIYIKTVKDSKTLYKYDPKHNKNVENILKNMSKYNISIIFNNNILKISINNNVLIDYNFDKIHVKHKKIEKVVVCDIAKYNTLLDNN